MKHLGWAGLLTLAVLCTPGCTPVAPAGADIVVTVFPLEMILSPLLPPGVTMHRLLPPGASPHTYEPSARDAQAVAASRVLIYVDDSLDGWAAELPAVQRIRVSDFLPDALRRAFALSEAQAHKDDEHDHEHLEGGFNSHFWTDPQAVAAVVPSLAAALAEADPAHAAHYARSAEQWCAELNALDAEVAAVLAPVRGAAVAEFHPSWDYFLARYDIRVVGLVEPAPGKEGSPRYLQGLIETLRNAQVRVVFTEPQLPSRPAEVVAEAIGARLVSMDPTGGNAPNHAVYRDWLLDSARTLRAAL